MLNMRRDAIAQVLRDIDLDRYDSTTSMIPVYGMKAGD
jgi:hypothetical protein